jgi:hypothetical protein
MGTIRVLKVEMSAQFTAHGTVLHWRRSHSVTRSPLTLGYSVLTATDNQRHLDCCKTVLSMTCTLALALRFLYKNLPCSRLSCLLAAAYLACQPSTFRAQMLAHLMCYLNHPNASHNA